MEKPPFQFGLKSLFAVTTAASLLLAVGMRVPTLLTGFALTAGIVFCWLMAVAAIEKAALRAIRLAGWFRNKLHTTLRNGRRANSEWQHRVLSTSAEKRQADGMNGYQFSLRTLLAAVAVVGIGVALWVAEPSWQIGILQTFFVLALPACVTVAAMQLSGPRRAFCVGLSFGTTIAAATFMFHVTYACKPELIGVVAGIFESDEGMQWSRGLSSTSSSFKVAAFQWAFAPVVGLLCVLTHRLFVRPPQGPQD